MGEEPKKAEVNQDSDKSKEEPPSNGSDSTVPPSITPTSKGAEPQRSATDATQRKKRWYRKCKLAERLSIIINAILAVVTAIGVGIFCGQWYEMRNDMKIDQRAWLGYEANLPIDIMGLGYPIPIPLTNYGKTFAVSIHSGARQICQANDPTFAQIKLCDEQALADSKNAYILAPGQRITTASDATGTLTQLDRTAVANGSKRLFVCGIVQYQDIFHTHHWTTFCAVLKETKLIPWVNEGNQCGEGDYPDWFQKISPSPAEILSPESNASNR